MSRAEELTGEVRLETAQQLMAKIAVPTVDADVISKLRELREPAIMFGETTVLRRQRLRECMFERGLTGNEGTVAAASAAKASGAVTIRTTEGFARGGAEVRAFRDKCFVDSMRQAKQRVAWLKQQFVEHQQQSTGSSDTAGLATFLHNVRSSRPGQRVYTSCTSDVAEDKSWLAMGTEDGQLELWDVEKSSQGPCTTVNANPGSRLTSVAGAVGQGLLACTTRTQAALLYKIDTSRLTGDCVEVPVTNIGQLQGHLGPVNRCAFHPTCGGSVLATSSEDITVRFWDTETQKQLWAQSGHHPQSRNVWALGFHPDGSLLTSTDHSGMALTFDLRSGRLAFRTPNPHNGKCTAVSWSPDGVRYATGGEDGLVMMWDARKQQQGNASSSAVGPVWDSGVGSPNGPLLCVAAHNDVVTDLKFEPCCAPDGSLGGLQFVSSGLDNSINVFEADSGALKRSLKGHLSAVRSFAFVNLRDPVSVTDSGKSHWGIASCGRDLSWKLWAVDETFDPVAQRKRQEEEEAAKAAAEANAGRGKVDRAGQPVVNGGGGDADSDSEDEMAALRKRKEQPKAAPVPAPPVAAGGGDDSDSEDEMAALRRKK